MNMHYTHENAESCWVAYCDICDRTIDIATFKSEVERVGRDHQERIHREQRPKACPHPFLQQHAVIDGKPVFHCGRCDKVVGK